MNNASPADQLAESCRSDKADFELDRGGKLAGFQGDPHGWTDRFIEDLSDEAAGYAPSRIETFWLRFKLNGDGSTLSVNLHAPPSEKSGTRESGGNMKTRTAILLVIVVLASVVAAGSASAQSPQCVSAVDLPPPAFPKTATFFTLRFPRRPTTQR
jgi:hypothetical protein